MFARDRVGAAMFVFRHRIRSKIRKAGKGKMRFEKRKAMKFKGWDSFEIIPTL
jgi:hypothetical protein